jgi:hypothetical protein
MHAVGLQFSYAYACAVRDSSSAAVQAMHIHCRRTDVHAAQSASVTHPLAASLVNGANLCTCARGEHGGHAEGSRAGAPM